LELARTKEWRESRGLTQRELAAKAGVGEVTVARIETGASVTTSTARKIAEALGVAVADLLERPPVPLAEAPQDPLQWEKVRTSVRERQHEVEAKVEELVALGVGLADPYQVKWALDEAQDCWHTLMLALPGSRREQNKIVLKIDPFSIDQGQWEQWEQSEDARRFYNDILERLVEAGLVEWRERPGQKALPVAVGIGA
jgi:transcriptional regulator with XRE-family HTH domain